MEKLVRLWTVFVLMLFICGIGLAESMSPGYREVRLTKRALPTRPLSQRFRGEVFSDGSVKWLISRRESDGRWSPWVPVSPAIVPAHLKKQMNTRIRSRLATRRFPEKDVIVSEDESPVGIPSTESEEFMLDEDSHMGDSGLASRTDFTWEELPSESSDSLSLQPVPPVSRVQRSYRPPSRVQPIVQRRVITRRVGVPPSPRTPPGEDDLAMYFEDQNVLPLVGGPLLTKATRLFRGREPAEELPSPTFGKKTHALQRPAGRAMAQPSNYDLCRMQWGFFRSRFNSRLDNVKIIKPVPPLGAKLSKTVTDCTRNFSRAFELQFLTVSGIIYSRKMKKKTANLVSKEIRQWCNGMMGSWYQQLQNMGLIIPKASVFKR